jgi:hypothetical protein
MPILPGYGLLNQGAPWQTAQGTILNTAATAIISPQAPGPQDFVLPGQPGGLQWYTGMALKLTARGLVTSGGTASNLTVAVAAGASGTLGSTLLTSGAIALGTTSLTLQVIKLEAILRVISLRTDGTAWLDSQGDLSLTAASTPTLTTASGVLVPMPYTTVLSSTLNPYTAGGALGLKGTLSAAFGSVQINQFLIEQVS